MLKFDKIWLTKRGLWRTNVYYNGDKYSEISDIDLLSVIQKLKDIEYNGEKIIFIGFKNL